MPILNPTNSKAPVGVATSASTVSPSQSPATAPVAAQPFVSGSWPYVGQFASFTNALQPGIVNVGQSNPIKLTSKGFVRGVILHVTATGGSGATTAAVMAPDAPWNVLQNLAFNDSQGKHIYGPFSSGYSAYVTNKYGGYRYVMGSCDPKVSNYSAPDANGNFSFSLRLPLEFIQRNGLGSLVNQNTGAQYQIELQQAAVATLFATSPVPTLPSVTVNLSEEAWMQPPATDLYGRPNIKTPPDSGTTQYWTSSNYPYVAGENELFLINRLGKYVRTWIFEFRNAAGARVAAPFNDPLTINIEGVDRARLTHHNWLEYTARTFGLNPNAAAESPGGPDLGVYAISRADDFGTHGGSGGEMRVRYLPTKVGEEIKVQFTSSAAGNLYVYTNDIAPSAAGTADMFQRIVL